MTLPKVVKAELVDGFRIRLEFSDASAGVVDFESRIVGRGGVFAELEDREVFARFEVDEEAGTLVWPNGVDFCPVMLHALAAGRDTAAA